VDAFYVSGSWLRLIGLEVTGVQVTQKGHTQSICFHNEGSHNVYERLLMHDGQAIGIYSVGGSDNLFLNCDAWNNWDYTSEDGKGGNVDGFGCHPPRGGSGNVFRGCRAWNNSDDGFDFINASESVTVENCWAFRNGFSVDGKRLADGNGFKIGGFASTPLERIPDPVPRHRVENCIAFGNKNSGFYANHHPGGSDWLRNQACQNNINFNMLGRRSGSFDDIDGWGHRMEHNVSFESRNPIKNIDEIRCELISNSFELDSNSSSAVTIIPTVEDLKKSRDQAGHLPAIQFSKVKKE
ncbi:MAG: right-handed parallel beta-helix repeat-containing protein, partial [Mariniblastus sp.]